MSKRINKARQIFRCNLCGKPYKRKFTLISHVHSKHTTND